MIRNFLFHRVNPQREFLWDPMSVEQFERCVKFISSKYEVVLFEKKTFLVIVHATVREHKDVHRFEKISNFIKQFKLSCTKSAAKFSSLDTGDLSDDERASSPLEGSPAHNVDPYALRRYCFSGHGSSSG